MAWLVHAVTPITIHPGASIDVAPPQAISIANPASDTRKPSSQMSASVAIHSSTRQQALPVVAAPMPAPTLTTVRADVARKASMRRSADASAVPPPGRFDGPACPPLCADTARLRAGRLDNEKQVHCTRRRAQTRPTRFRSPGSRGPSRPTRLHSPGSCRPSRLTSFRSPCSCRPCFARNVGTDCRQCRRRHALYRQTCHTVTLTCAQLQKFTSGLVGLPKNLAPRPSIMTVARARRRGGPALRSGPS